MDTVQARTPRSMEENQGVHEIERQPVIIIGEVVLKEIKIYAEIEDLNVADILSKIMGKEVKTEP